MMWRLRGGAGLAHTGTSGPSKIILVATDWGEDAEGLNENE
jgi:hypothetical protein